LVEVRGTRPGYAGTARHATINAPRLEGTWDVTIRDLEAENILGGVTTVQRLWEFEPLCRQGACDVELTRQVQEGVQQMRMHRDGIHYLAKDAYTLGAVCDNGEQVADATLWRNRFRVEVTDWRREAGVLTATRLRARLVSDGEPTEAGLRGCSQGGRLVSIATGEQR
jgi:hypothetical protein